MKYENCIIEETESKKILIKFSDQINILNQYDLQMLTTYSTTIEEQVHLKEVNEKEFSTMKFL